MSPTTFNCALDAIRQTLDLAVEAGHLFTNPARDKMVKRATPKLKRFLLPSREQFRAMVASVDQAGVGECRAAAEMIKFLAFTGARQMEANRVERRDVDFSRARITLRITKNGEPRDVPMMPECLALLTTMRKPRSHEDLTAPVLRVKECRGFLERACRHSQVPPYPEVSA